MAEKKLTVAEMLAAARKADARGGPAETPPEAPAEEKPAASKPVAPAAKTPAASGGARPSIAEMMAMARGGGAAPAASKEKPAPKPAAAKVAPAKKEVAAAKSEPVDTQSILAAARKSTKPGPMTKAEASAKASPAAPDAKKAKAKEAIVVPPMPVRPAYAKPGAAKVVKDAAVAERRAFIFGMSALAVGFTALTATAAAWTLGTVRFMFPNILREPPSKFSVGTTDKFPPGQVEERFKAQFGVWIVNTEYNGQQEIFALKSVCTHLGCTPNWLDAEQKFKCPCHGSGYYKDGINFEGPAPRPLERYAISIGSDGSIEVDKSRTFQQEMGDWDNPACFIPV
jgi:cytochrome b6-f complex iron-sulfur subunit